MALLNLERPGNKNKQETSLLQKKYFNYGIQTVGDLRFDPNNIDSYELIDPSFKIDCGLFDVTKKKSKDYYSLFVRKKACFPNNARKLKCEFNLI